MGKAWDKHEDYDASFGYWLAGFIDGEGCFRIQKHARGSATCTFQIKVRDDDEAIIRRARDFLGAGTITRENGDGNQNPQIKWIVQDKAGCTELVALLTRFPLRAKKLRDFLHWAEAVTEWCGMERGNRWHGRGDYSRMLALKSQIESARSYKSPAWSGNGFQDWCREWAEEVLRVLKPGGHLLAFGGTRTYHRLACGIEDAGFEIRNQIQWVFGSGFPKSLNVAKAIGDDPRAADWEGWGSDLKPAHEPIVVARKPLTGTVAQNVLEWGTGAINVDGCRVPHDGTGTWGAKNTGDTRGVYGSFADEAGLPSSTRNDLGRFPANIIHDGSDEVLAEFAKYGESKSSGKPRNNTQSIAAVLRITAESLLSGMATTTPAPQPASSTPLKRARTTVTMGCGTGTVKKSQWLTQPSSPPRSCAI
jgi:hypothetical protein